jgi:hypothetical protein
MDLIVGKYYQVPCAEINMNGDGQTFPIPVFNHLHADPQFEFHHKHFHIDGRFEIHPRMVHEFNITDGYTAAVIVPESGAPYKFRGLEHRELKCIRLHTGLKVPDVPTADQQPKVDRYNSWYYGFIGVVCAGRKCPHFGTEMLAKDGLLVCPLHNLTADLHSLKIIARKS